VADPSHKYSTVADPTPNIGRRAVKVGNMMLTFEGKAAIYKRLVTPSLKYYKQVCYHSLGIEDVEERKNTLT
jgi:hypothetical protein